MKKPGNIPACKGQAAVEYLLIFAITAVVAILAFTTFVPRSREIANEYFGIVADELMGDPVQSDDIP